MLGNSPFAGIDNMEQHAPDFGNFVDRSRALNTPEAFVDVEVNKTAEALIDAIPERLAKSDEIRVFAAKITTKLELEIENLGPAGSVSLGEADERFRTDTILDMVRQAEALLEQQVNDLVNERVVRSYFIQELEEIAKSGDPEIKGSSVFQTLVSPPLSMTEDEAEGLLKDLIVHYIIPASKREDARNGSYTFDPKGEANGRTPPDQRHALDEEQELCERLSSVYFKNVRILKELLNKTPQQAPEGLITARNNYLAYDGSSTGKRAVRYTYMPAQFELSDEEISNYIRQKAPRPVTA